MHGDPKTDLTDSSVMLRWHRKTVNSCHLTIQLLLFTPSAPCLGLHTYKGLPIGTRRRNGCSSQHGLLYQVGKQGQAEPLAEIRCVGRTRDGPCMIWQFLLAQHWHPWQEQLGAVQERNTNSTACRKYGNHMGVITWHFHLVELV